MNVRFHDLENIGNPMNGARIGDALALGGLTRALAGREPFMFELRSERGFTLTIGLAPGFAAVQHAPSDGGPPQLMAVADDAGEDGGGQIEFRAGGAGEATPVPARFCVSHEQMETIATDFLADGGRSGTVSWEAI